MLQKAGFDGVELVGETGYNSSPKTKGVLVRGRRPPAAAQAEEGAAMGDMLATYQEFFQAAYAPGALDAKTKILISLGASLGTGCEP